MIQDQTGNAVLLNHFLTMADLWELHGKPETWRFFLLVYISRRFS